MTPTIHFILQIFNLLQILKPIFLKKNWLPRELIEKKITEKANLIKKVKNYQILKIINNKIIIKNNNKNNKNNNKKF